MRAVYETLYEENLFLKMKTTILFVFLSVNYYNHESTYKKLNLPANGIFKLYYLNA